MAEKLKRWLAESALSKTVIFVVSIILAGILCGAFVTEITHNGVIRWKLFYKAKSFYLLLIFSFGVYLYNRFMCGVENRIRNYMDKDYCRAYIRSECLPELTKKYKEIIRNGQSGEELKEIQADLEDLIK